MQSAKQNEAVFKILNCTTSFTSPSWQVYYNNANVRQVDVPSFSGSFGILPSHVPTLAVLKPGVMTVFEDAGTSKRYFVSSGIVTINEDSSGIQERIDNNNYYYDNYNK